MQLQINNLRLQDCASQPPGCTAAARVEPSSHRALRHLHTSDLDQIKSSTRSTCAAECVRLSWAAAWCDVFSTRTRPVAPH